MTYQDHSVDGSGFFFQNGYYSFGSQNWKDIEVSARFLYNSGEIGLIPRLHSDISFLIVTIGNHNSLDIETGEEEIKTIASLLVRIGEEEISLGVREDLPPLISETEYEIKVSIRRTNYQIHLNDLLIFNIEYGGLSQGKAAIYSTEGNICEEVEVRSLFPDGWSSNVDEVNEAVVDMQELPNKDRLIHLSNPSSGELYIKQILQVEGGKEYWLSYNKLGAVKARIEELDSALPQVFNIEGEEERVSSSAVVSEDCSEVAVIFYLNEVGEGSVNDIQFEKGKLSTSYIHNESLNEGKERKESFITFPAKNNINPEEGALSLWVKPLNTYNKRLGLRPVLFEYGEGEETIRLLHNGSAFQLDYGDESLVNDASSFEKDKWYHIVAMWSEIQLSLYVNYEKSSADGIYEFDGQSEIIHFGHSKNQELDSYDGLLEEIIIFDKPITEEEILSLYEAEEPVPQTQNMLLRAGLNHAVSDYNSSIIEMSPAPTYGSPVIVEKEDGTIMRKVSFFDPDTGEYRTWNEEEFIYDGRSDYVRVGIPDIDTENFKIQIKDSKGIQYGEPYRVSGNRVDFHLSEEEKRNLRGQKLYIRYQPENAYTVDFNIGMMDSFRVGVGKHDGQPLKVQYEGNRFSDEKLATMIELNPLKNPNHQGFLYITNKSQELSSYRLKISPAELPADGVSESIIIIEPVDLEGNFISHLKLSVAAEEGFIVPNYDPESIRLRSIAGRYIYRYRSPLIRLSERDAFELKDSISIRDEASGIGVQTSILLSLKESYPGENHQISPEERDWEMIAVRLLDRVMDYYGKETSSLPDGLKEILDFNNDGVIDLDEIVWLNDHKYSQEMYNKYVELITWDQQ